MTNEELKLEIICLIRDSADEWMEKDDEGHTIIYLGKIADALIAAGLRFGENLTATFAHMALEREHKLERRLSEATKAMYVYERALYYASLNGETADEVKYNDALKRAQKDFAENKGD